MKHPDQMEVADGAWVMPDPLRRGAHVIHFSVTAYAHVEQAPEPGFSLDVTYNLTVR